jgi:DNA adenine methylase
MRYKRPAPMASIAIDIDADVVQQFRRTNPDIPNLELHILSALEWLAPGPAARYYTDPHTLIYLDPPYLMSTRSTQRALYKYEFATEAEHDWLLSLIKGMRCMVAISGYASELYADRLKGWRAIQFPAMTRGGTIATEWLWMNYPAPLELHDCRYLGKNFRERERINRKKQRWSDRLKNMDPLERQALLSAIDELRGSPIA